MNAQKAHFRLGLFTLGAIALAIVGLVLLGQGIWFRQTLLVETYFDQSVSGLSIGAPVRQRGVDVGRVTKIGFVTSKYEVPPGNTGGGSGKYSIANLILVEMTIDQNRVRTLNGPSGDPKTAVEGMIKDGLRLKLVSSLLGGDGYIDADFVEDPSRYPTLVIPWTPTDIYIPSVPNSGSRLMETLDHIAGDIQDAHPGEILKHVDALVQDAKRLTGGIDSAKLQGEAMALMGNLRDATKDVQKILDDPQISSILANTSSATGNIRTLTDPEKSNLSHLIEDFRKTTASLQTLLNDPSLRQAIGNTGPLTTDARRLVARLAELMTGEQQDLAQLIQSLNASAQNIEAITGDAKENPARILFGAPPSKRTVIIVPENK